MKLPVLAMYIRSGSDTSEIGKMEHNTRCREFIQGVSQ